MPASPDSWWDRTFVVSASTFGAKPTATRSAALMPGFERPHLLILQNSLPSPGVPKHLKQDPHSGRPREFGHPPYDYPPGISGEIQSSSRLGGKTFKPAFTPQNQTFPRQDQGGSLPFEILRRMVFSKPIFIGKVL